jgi:hypothetical protein
MQEVEAMLALLAAAAMSAGTPTLGELRKRGLVEVARDRILGPCGPSCTGLIPVIIMGPKELGRRFVSGKQYLCEIHARQPERNLICFPLSGPVIGSQVGKKP